MIAGFVAYVSTCAPSALRVRKAPLRSAIEATTNILDMRGKLDKAPESLGRKTMSELLSHGTVSIEIDEKYPQAIGISNVMTLIGSFGNFPWEILINGEPSSPFFTSDFPAAIEKTADARVLNKIIPLAPDIAIRILPDLSKERVQDPALTFPSFRYRTLTVTGKALRNLNRLIVQAAESIVFYRDDRDWVKRFVARYNRYRIEPTSLKIPHGNGYLIVSGQRLASQ